MRLIFVTVGVVIALFNGARFVEKQLDTIRLQNRRPDRVVMCDDGSKDGTVEIVREYIRKYELGDSWQLYINEKNLGYIRNFYKTMSLCNTDLIYLSDQDDIWDKDKIRKMTEIMESRNDIDLLSCRYGIIDANGQVQKSFVEGSIREDGELKAITVKEILRAYRWPGMIMCIRSDFFKKLLPCIENCDVAHDFMFSVCSADRNSFFEYGYLGSYHRRHDSNTAREEHRISKLLNLERKLTEISVTKTLWNNFLSVSLPIREETRQLLARRLDSLTARGTALKEKSLSKILNVYKNDPDHFLRKKSLICDLWLVLFGSRKEKIIK